MAKKPTARIPQELQMAHAIPVSTPKADDQADETAKPAADETAKPAADETAKPAVVAPVVVDSVAPAEPAVKPPKSIEKHFSGATVIDH